MSRHIIHKQMVTLHISQRDETYAIQDKVSSLFAGDLGESMEDVFNKIAPTGKLIRIESLLLNLGTINKQNFEEEFKERFISRLQDGVSATVESVLAKTKNNDSGEVHSSFETFTYFLQNGYLPWYAESKNIREWESEMEGGSPDEMWINFPDWFIKNFNAQRVILQRLVSQFSDGFLEKILVSAAPQWKVYWKEVYKDMYFILEKLYNLRSATTREEILKHSFSTIFGREQHSELPIARQTYEIMKSLIRELSNDAAPGNIDDLELENEIRSEPARSAFIELVKSNLLNDKISFAKKDKIIPGESDKIGPEEKDRESVKKNEITEDGLYVKNSGIVILHPFLQPFFEELELLKKGEFTNTEACQRSILLLHYLATAEVEAAEYDLVLEKVLCGYPIKETLPSSIELSEKEITESQKLLTSIIGHWTILKNTSIQGLQSTFMVREGKLSSKESGWFLKVERKTVDILLDKLPWGFSTIKLPWMENILSVDWY